MPGFELVGKEERDCVNEIFDSSNGVLFAHGFDGLRNGRYRVREFEKEFSAKIGCGYTQAVTSGTVAQYVAMKAMGVKEGDEVITQAFTFVATVESILALGATPVIVNIDDTYNMDPEELKKAITEKTKLIVPVHMLGNPADMEPINAIANEKRIPVLEDGCEALGAKYKGQYVGTLSQAGIFSLDFAKTITCGEGGLITTSNEKIWRYAKEFHDHGHESNPDFPRGRDTRTIPGMNFRITEMQAAVASAQLVKLDRIVELNRRNKSILRDYVSKDSRVTFRRITDEEGDLADTLIFRFEDKKLTEQFVEKLVTAGLFTKNVPDAIDWHFSGTWNHMFVDVPAYRDCWSTVWSRSADLLDRSISLPIFVNKSEDDMKKDGETVLRILNSL